MPTSAIDDRGVLIACPSCGKTNRIAYAALDKSTRCGSCHQAAVDAPGAPLDVPSTQAFDALVAKSSIPVVVDFWAPWCGPCRMMAPELDKLAAKTAGRWLIAKVNTDALPDLGERYRIRSIPTMGVFVGGREIARESGARPAAQIEAFVAQKLTTNAA